jgi:3-deoxy-D-manno-octulosonic-acid transferase
MGYVLYNLALLLATAVLLPYVAIMTIAKRQHHGWRERFGFLPKLPGERPVVWIHGVSVGEILAAGPVIDALMDFSRDPSTPASRESPFRLVLSTVTETGQQIARQRYGSKAVIVRFPVDLRFSVACALERLHPSLVLILETEIWPNFLRECSRRGIPVLLVNGRLSERSFRRYRWVRPFMKHVLDNFRLLLMQSEDDARRIEELGASSARIHVVGNVKWDARPPADEAVKAEELARCLGLSRERPLIVAGSTAPGEETVILRAFELLRTDHAELRATRLLIAPRRPERFDDVENLLRALGWRFLRRTRATDPETAALADVILLDTIGELAAVYRWAHVAIIGGSFFTSLAHNVVEPLMRGACVIVGPRYSDPNFPAYAAGVWRISAPSLHSSAAGAREALARALAHALSRLLLDAELRARFHEATRAFLARHRGAAERIRQHLEPLLIEAMTRV